MNRYLSRARGAVGGVRGGLMVWRPALRADSAALLGLRARRETRSTHCVRCAQTVPASQMNEARGYARRPQPCAARRPTNRPRRVPPAARYRSWCGQNRMPSLVVRGGWCPGWAIYGAARSGGTRRARTQCALPHLTRGDWSSAANAVSVASFAAPPRAEHRSGVGAQRRPPHHELTPDTARRAARSKHAPQASTHRCSTRGSNSGYARSISSTAAETPMIEIVVTPSTNPKSPAYTADTNRDPTPG